MKAKFLATLPLIAALAACGGGTGGSASLGTGEGTVAVLVTDNLTQDYAEVWITVQSISASDSNGQPVTLYEDTSGQTHNMSQLANIGALVDAQNIAAGSYSEFTVVLANSISLVDQNGNVTDATFDQSGNPTFSITVPGSLTVDANQTATLALDFDLQQFTYDANSNTVTPVVVQKDPTQLDQTVGTVFGEVERVIDGTQFVLDPARNGRDLTVVLHANASVTNTATGEVLADTSGLNAGMRVSVSGNFDSATLTITAANVQIENGATGVRHELEGIIESVNGANISVDLFEANFMPGANSISVDVSNAAFSHGALSDLAVGRKIEIKGSWDGINFMPAVVEIEGYSRNGRDDEHDYDDDYAEVEAEITAVAAGQLTVTVREHEHISSVGFDAAAPLTIDSSNSWIEHGDNSCLVAGTVIEAKGPMSDAATMVANKIEIERGCGSRSDDMSDDEDDDDDDSDDLVS